MLSVVVILLSMTMVGPDRDMGTVLAARSNRHSVVSLSNCFFIFVVVLVIRHL